MIKVGPGPTPFASSSPPPKNQEKNFGKLKIYRSPKKMEPCFNNILETQSTFKTIQYMWVLLIDREKKKKNTNVSGTLFTHILYSQVILFLQPKPNFYKYKYWITIVTSKFKTKLNWSVCSVRHK